MDGKHKELQVQQSGCEHMCGIHTHIVALHLALAGICLTGVSCLSSWILRLGLGLRLTWMGVVGGWQQVMVQV